MHSVFIGHVERLRRLVVAMGLSAEEGQDILQDVYVEAVKGPPKYRGDQEVIGRGMACPTIVWPVPQSQFYRTALRSQRTP